MARPSAVASVAAHWRQSLSFQSAIAASLAAIMALVALLMAAEASAILAVRRLHIRGLHICLGAHVGEEMGRLFTEIFRLFVGLGSERFTALPELPCHLVVLIENHLHALSAFIRGHRGQTPSRRATHRWCATACYIVPTLVCIHSSG